MSPSTVSATKKIGRPATGKGTPVQVRMPADELAALDAWIALQPEPRPNRQEAIRGLIRGAVLTSVDVVPAQDEGLRPDQLNAENDG